MSEDEDLPSIADLRKRARPCGYCGITLEEDMFTPTGTLLIIRHNCSVMGEIYIQSPRRETALATWNGFAHRWLDPDVTHYVGDRDAPFCMYCGAARDPKAGLLVSLYVDAKLAACEKCWRDTSAERRYLDRAKYPDEMFPGSSA